MCTNEWMDTCAFGQSKNYKCDWSTQQQPVNNSLHLFYVCSDRKIKPRPRTKAAVSPTTPQHRPDRGPQWSPRTWPTHRSKWKVTLSALLFDLQDLSSYPPTLSCSLFWLNWQSDNDLKIYWYTKVAVVAFTRWSLCLPSLNPPPSGLLAILPFCIAPVLNS